MDKESIADSAEAFAAQFDPDDENYHGGDPTPVPIGGGRVPETMPTEYDPGAVYFETPSDPEYYRVSEARNVLLEFKKLLGLIPQAAEAVMRARRFKDPLKKEEQVAVRSQALTAAIEQAWQVKESLAGYSDLVPCYESEVSDLIQAGATQFANKQQYGEYMFWISKFSQRVFKDAQDLLQRMKQIKRG